VLNTWLLPVGVEAVQELEVKELAVQVLVVLEQIFQVQQLQVFLFQKHLIQ
jgi:uncharacterized pyridoxamine 5'-phosphate oxidase family protein